MEWQRLALILSYWLDGPQETLQKNRSYCLLFIIIFFFLNNDKRSVFSECRYVQVRLKQELIFVL